eukprot:sb/3460566/
MYSCKPLLTEKLDLKPIPSTPYLCGVCLKKYKSASALEKHIWLTKNSDSYNNKHRYVGAPYECNSCELDFCDRPRLTDHLIEVHDETTLTEKDGAVGIVHVGGLKRSTRNRSKRLKSPAKDATESEEDNMDMDYIPTLRDTDEEDSAPVQMYEKEPERKKGGRKSEGRRKSEAKQQEKEEERLRSCQVVNLDDPTLIHTTEEDQYESYLCQTCDLACVDAESIHDHHSLMRESRDWDEKHMYVPYCENWAGDFRCSYCAVRFERSIDLHQHQVPRCPGMNAIVVQGGPKRLKAPKIEIQFSDFYASIRSAKDSYKGKRGSDIIHCTICEVKFSSNSKALYRHLDLMKESDDFNTKHVYVGHLGAFECSYCNRNWPLRKDLEAHQVSKCEHFSLSVPVPDKNAVPAVEGATTEHTLVEAIVVDTGIMKKEIVEAEKEGEKESDGIEDKENQLKTAENAGEDMVKASEDTGEDNMKAEKTVMIEIVTDTEPNQTGVDTSPASEDNKDKPTCAICFLKFNSMDFLERHQILMTESIDFNARHVSINGTFKCSYCYATCESDMDLMKHQYGWCDVYVPSTPNELPGKGPVTIHLENIRGNAGKENWRIEFYKNTITETVSCKVCSKIFKGQLQLNKHMVIMQSSPEFCEKKHNYIGQIVEGKYQCSGCEVRVQGPAQMEQHQRTACLKKQADAAVCGHCNKKFPSLFELGRHLYWMQSSICFRGSDHNTCVIDGPCLYCGKMLPEDKLEEHHFSECWRSRVSPIVRGQKSSFDVQGPQKKLELHCYHCGLYLNTPAKRLRHQATMALSVDFDEYHNPSQGVLLSNGRFRCSYCGKSRRSKWSLEEHQRKMLCKKFSPVWPATIEDVWALRKQQPTMLLESDSENSSGPEDRTFKDDEWKELEAGAKKKSKKQAPRRRNRRKTKVEKFNMNCQLCFRKTPGLEVDLGKFATDLMHLAMMTYSVDFTSDTHEYVGEIIPPSKQKLKDTGKESVALVSRYQCSYCGTILSNLTSLERHQFRKCLNTNIFAEVQKLQKFEFVDFRGLNFRFTQGLKIQNYSCQQCGQTRKLRSDPILRQRHYLICNQSTDFDSRTHMYMKKEGQSGYTCSYCMKWFHDCNALEEHQFNTCDTFQVDLFPAWELIQTVMMTAIDMSEGQEDVKEDKNGNVIKSHRCSTCRASFGLAKTLAGHLLLMNKSWDFNEVTHRTYDESFDGAFYRCSYCQRKYKSQAELATHQTHLCRNFSPYQTSTIEDIDKDLGEHETSSMGDSEGAAYIEEDDSEYYSDDSGEEQKFKEEYYTEEDEEGYYEEEDAVVSPVPKERIQKKRTRSENEMEAGEPPVKKHHQEVSPVKKVVVAKIEEQEEADGDLPEFELGEEVTEAVVEEDTGAPLAPVTDNIEYSSSRVIEKYEEESENEESEEEKAGPKSYLPTKSILRRNRLKTEEQKFNMTCKLCFRKTTGFEVDLGKFSTELMHLAMMTYSVDFTSDTHEYVGKFITKTRKNNRDTIEHVPRYRCSYCGFIVANPTALEKHQVRKCPKFNIYIEVKKTEMMQFVDFRGLEFRFTHGLKVQKHTCQVCGQSRKLRSDPILRQRHYLICNQSIDFDSTTHFYQRKEGTIGYNCSYCMSWYHDQAALEEHQFNTCAKFHIDLLPAWEFIERCMLTAIDMAEELVKEDEHGDAIECHMCTTCGESFCLAKNLAGHLLLMNKSWDFNEVDHCAYDESFDGVFYRCSYCQRKYRSQAELATHQTHLCRNFSPYTTSTMIGEICRVEISSDSEGYVKEEELEGSERDEERAPDEVVDDPEEINLKKRKQKKRTRSENGMGTAEPPVKKQLQEASPMKKVDKEEDDLPESETREKDTGVVVETEKVGSDSKTEKVDSESETVKLDSDSKTGKEGSDSGKEDTLVKKDEPTAGAPLAPSAAAIVTEEHTMAANKKLLYVGGLAEECNEKVLHSAFVVFGDIVDVNVPIDYATNAHRGFGFVEFEAAEDAAAAMDNMNESEIFGRTIRVNIAKPMKMTERSVLADIGRPPVHCCSSCQGILFVMHVHMADVFVQV